MSLGPLFLGFMFLFDSQIALQNEGIVHSVIDIFPDFIAWLLFIWAVKKESPAKKFLSGLEKMCYAPLIISAANFVFSAFMYDSMYFADGKPRIATAITEIVLHFLECAFAFMLFSRLSKFTFGKRETPNLSKSFDFAKVFSIAELFTASVALIVSLNAPNNICAGIAYLFRVTYIWFSVIILFRCASKYSD